MPDDGVLFRDETSAEWVRSAWTLWPQTDTRESVYTTSVKDTTVEISPTSSGGWKLRLTENGLGTSVKRRR